MLRKYQISLRVNFFLARSVRNSPSKTVSLKSLILAKHHMVSGTRALLKEFGIKVKGGSRAAAPNRAMNYAFTHIRNFSSSSFRKRGEGIEKKEKKSQKLYMVSDTQFP